MSWSFLGPGCGCNCAGDPPGEEFARNRVAGAILFKPGLPAFHPHTALEVVAQVYTLLSQLPPRTGVSLVTGDGDNNGLWYRPGAAAATRLSGYETAAALATVLCYAASGNGPWWVQTATAPPRFSDLVFDGAAMRRGDYSGVFARETFAWEFRSGRFQQSTVNVGGGSYYGQFGFLRGDVLKVVSGSGAVLGASMALADGVQVSSSEWQPVVAIGPARWHYRVDLGRVVPGKFTPGEWCVDTTNGNVYVCKSGFTTAVGAASGSDTAPSADPAHWALGAFSRAMPWDATAISYEAQGPFITSARAKRRFRSLSESTTVVSANTVTAARSWSFGEHGQRRDLARYTQSGYSPLGSALLPAAPGGNYEPGLLPSIQGSLEFPAMLPLVRDFVTNYPGAIAKVVSSVATATSWTLHLSVQVPWYWVDVAHYPQFPRDTTLLDVTYTLTLGDEVDDIAWQAEAVSRCEADFALLPTNASAVLGVDLRSSDGTRVVSSPKPPSGLTPHPITPWAVLASDPQTGAGSSFCGLVDFWAYAQHGEFTFCSNASGTPPECRRLERGRYWTGGLDTTVLPLNCALVGPLRLDYPPDGVGLAWQHAVSATTGPC